MFYAENNKAKKILALFGENGTLNVSSKQNIEEKWMGKGTLKNDIGLPRKPEINDR